MIAIPTNREQRRLRIAHVVLSLDAGGLERIVVDLVAAARRAGHQPLVICLERPGTLAARASQLGARVLSLGKQPGLAPGLVPRLRSIFRRPRPDVVHSHQVAALCYAGPAARLAGVPTVVHTEHGKHYASRARTRWLGRASGIWAERFFCVSQEIAADVRNLRVAARDKIHFLPNGIDPRPFTSPLDRDARRAQLGVGRHEWLVGTVGRLAEIKCHDVLLRAFARLVETIAAARLLLVGDGPRRAELQSLAARLGIADRVRFAGYQPDPENYLRLMDVFALTSRSEGMPLAVLEAWAAGVPVVATRVGGLPGMIDEGRTGLLVPPQDDAAMAAALTRVIEDAALRDRLCRAGREEFDRAYHLDAMAERYERHYRELLGRPQSSLPLEKRSGVRGQSLGLLRGAPPKS
jgi:sugar transferase (PEP-CTERM/EpsH1 system associated)